MRMDLDDIKAQFDRIFAARSRGASREQASLLREALVEFKVSIGQIREALAKSERELEAARREVVDYERRGKLAAGINDAETASLAEIYTAKAKAKVDLLERKVIVQRDELLMAEKEYESTKARFQSAAHGIPLESPSADLSAEPGATEAHDGLDDPYLDQRAREAAVDAQLALLKKKLGERK
jgi:hypothetical protein